MLLTVDAGEKAYDGMKATMRETKNGEVVNLRFRLQFGTFWSTPLLALVLVDNIIQNTSLLMDAEILIPTQCSRVSLE